MRIDPGSTDPSAFQPVGDDAACGAQPETQADPGAAAANPIDRSGSTGDVQSLVSSLLQHTLDLAVPGGGAATNPASQLGLLQTAMKLFQALQANPEAGNEVMQKALYDHGGLCGAFKGFGDALQANPGQAILDGLRSLSAATEGTGLAECAPRPEISGQTSGRIGRSASHYDSVRGDWGRASVDARGHAGARSSASGDASIGMSGLDASGRASAQAGLDGRVTGRLRTDAFSAAATAEGNVGVRGDAAGQVHADLSGVRAQGQASARVGVDGSLSGRLRSDLLDANARVAADVQAYAEANGTATIDGDGLRATGRAEVGVRAQVEVDADFRTAGTTIGGQRLDLNGQIHAQAEASARASVDADVAATIRPPRLLADLQAEAFVGVKAGVEGSLGLGDFVTVSGHAAAWAGAGAEAGIIAGYDDGKLTFGFNLGAAVEVGAGGGVAIEIDVKALASAAIGFLTGSDGEFDLDMYQDLAAMFPPFQLAESVNPDAARRALADFDRALQQAMETCRNAA